MPSNVQLDAGSGGSIATTKQLTHDGDTTQCQGVHILGISGTEDSYTGTTVQAGGGVEASALRVTIANDSTGVVSVDDNGGSLTVDGTVAVSGSVAVTDNSGSLTVDNAALSVTGGGVEASALRVTIANDSTGVVSVDDNGGNLSVDDGGGSLTVDGTVAVSSITTSIVPGTGATNLGKAVDSAAGGTDTGVAALAIRDDTLSTLTPADGDYTQLRVDSTGALHVRVSNAVASVVDDAAFTPASGEGVVIMGFADETSPDSVDEGDAGAIRMTLARAMHINVRDDAGDSCMDGTNNALRVNIVAGAGSGGTAMTDDAAFTPGSTSITPMGAMFDDVSPDSVNEGDGGVVRMSANRNLYVTLRDAAGNERGLNVDASGNIGVTDAGGVLSVDDGAGSLTVDNAALAVTGGGTESGALRVTIASDSTGVVSVDDNGGNLSVDDGGGSLTVDGTVTAAGAAAHDAAVSGNPNRIAGRARTSDYTAVANDDTADLLATLNGKLVIQPYAIPENTWSYAAGSGGITNTTGVTARAAAGAGVRNYITGVDVVNGHATVSTEVVIRDGAAGTVLWRGFAQAAGGGVSRQFDPPLRGTANTLVEIANITTGSATYFNLTGYAGP